MQTMTDRTKVEKVLKAMDLVVVCDVYISETAAFADIVLPESTYLEREEAIFDYFRTRQPIQFASRLLKPLGIANPVGKYGGAGCKNGTW